MNPALQPLLDLLIDGRTKGYPPGAPALPLGALGRQGWRLQDLSLPVAVLRQSALDRNSRWMAEFLRRTGASLCPHGKTTMAPQLFHRQLADGAWGITLATPQQVRVAHAYGVKRILLANELVGEGEIRWIQETLDLDPDFDFTCLVDSPAGVERLEAAARGGARILPVLVELGIAGGRTGARTPEEGLAVARAVKASPRLALRGVECYEGIVGTQDPAADEASVVRWLDLLGGFARRCSDEHLFETDEVLLTAGGSAFFDLVVSRLGRVDLGRPTRVLLRSGCYLTHDGGHYARLGRLLEGRLPEPWRIPAGPAPALELWGQVLSRPEPGLACLNFGKRDAGHDLGLPQPRSCIRSNGPRTPLAVPESWRIIALYDQHAKVELPPDAVLEPGDRVGCTISHPCTTFDKWPLVFLLDDDDRVVDALKTYF